MLDVRTIAIEEHFRSETFRKLQASGQLGDAGRDSPLIEPVLGKLYDVGAARLAELDAAGIEVQLLSHTPPGPEVLDSAAAVTMAREVNDELAVIVRANPNRYAGFAMLPTPNPDAAAEELRRAVDELGLRGAMLYGTTAGRFLDEPFFSPIFEAAERMSVPVYLHPAPPSPTVRNAYYSGFSPEVSSVLATSAWGWHIETGLHVLRLVLSGLFDRHPNLQVIIGHMGEAVPYMLARSDSVLSRFTQLERPVRDYFAQNIHYTNSGFFTQEPLTCLLGVIGVDRLLFAVDYPFSSNIQARQFLDSALVSAADREKIAHGNAEALLKI